MTAWSLARTSPKWLDLRVPADGLRLRQQKALVSWLCLKHPGNETYQGVTERITGVGAVNSYANNHNLLFVPGAPGFVTFPKLGSRPQQTHSISALPIRCTESSGRQSQQLRRGAMARGMVKGLCRRLAVNRLH